MARKPITADRPVQAENAASAPVDDRSFTIFPYPAVAKLAAVH
jgi:hypothetical protein